MSDYTKHCIFFDQTLQNLLTVKIVYAVKLTNILVKLVIQLETIVDCSTVRSSWIHVKFEKSWLTCSCVLSSPAMNCPVPKGYDIDETNSAKMPG